MIAHSLFIMPFSSGLVLGDHFGRFSGVHRQMVSYISRSIRRHDVAAEVGVDG